MPVWAAHTPAHKTQKKGCDSGASQVPLITRSLAASGWRSGHSRRTNTQTHTRKGKACLPGRNVNTSQIPNSNLIWVTMARVGSLAKQTHCVESIGADVQKDSLLIHKDRFSFNSSASR